MIFASLSFLCFCLLASYLQDVVTAFPLYSEALKFAQYEDMMIQTAVRALTLNIFNGINIIITFLCLWKNAMHEILDKNLFSIFFILQHCSFGSADSDEMVFQFITSPPASQYFQDLVYSLREKCICLDGLIQDTEYVQPAAHDFCSRTSKETSPFCYMHKITDGKWTWIWCRQTCPQQRKNDILQESDKIVDDLSYFKDILSVGEPRLSKVVIENLLSLLVFPILLPFLQLRKNNVR